MTSKQSALEALDKLIFVRFDALRWDTNIETIRTYINSTEDKCEARGKEHCWKHDRNGEECQAGNADGDAERALKWLEGMTPDIDMDTCSQEDFDAINTISAALQSTRKPEK